MAHQIPSPMPQGQRTKNGVDDGARTHDRRNHNPELYQLSYAHHGDVAAKPYILSVSQPKSILFWLQTNILSHQDRKWRARQDYSGHPRQLLLHCSTSRIPAVVPSALRAALASLARSDRSIRSVRTCNPRLRRPVPNAPDQYDPVEPARPDRAIFAAARSQMARPAGLEPATPGLEGRCSIRLSYGRPRSKRASNRPAFSKSERFFHLVGVEGFEPPTHCSQSSCATRLRYTPNCGPLYRHREDVPPAPGRAASPRRSGAMVRNSRWRVNQVPAGTYKKTAAHWAPPLLLHSATGNIRSRSADVRARYPHPALRCARGLRPAFPVLRRTGPAS
jgi:hypothetical protein